MPTITESINGLKCNMKHILSYANIRIVYQNTLFVVYAHSNKKRATFGLNLRKSVSQFCKKLYTKTPHLILVFISLVVAPPKTCKVSCKGLFHFLHNLLQLWCLFMDIYFLMPYGMDKKMRIKTV